jgi:uncharacterized protein (TIGR00369 family)
VSEHPLADRYAPLPPHLHRRWMRYGTSEVERYAELLGLVVEDVRVDYCRMRLPWRREVSQPFGVLHGGALASLIDSVVVPAIGSGYEEAVGFATTDLTVQYLGALRDDDVIAEGWVTKRGRTTIFCEATARSARRGDVIARGLLTYRVLGPTGTPTRRDE